MKNKNKIIAVIVAIVLAVSVFVVGTVANTKNTSIQIAIDKTQLSAGETATVTVTATADYPVATASIPVFYDKTMVTVSDETVTLTGYDVAEVTTDANAVDSSKIYAETGIDSEKFGFVLVTYIGGANDSVSTIENKTLLTFTITAKADVSGDALIKCVTESAKTEDNIEGMLYFGATTSGTTITSIPENVENIDASSATASVVITNGDTELVTIENTTAVIDAENKYVYGITPGEKVEDYFKVNNGTLELVANTTGVTNGTGATVNVKNASGTVVDTYTVIIFGDVNGDGAVTATDTNTIKVAAMGGSIEAGAKTFAADVNGDDSVTATDTNTIKVAAMGGSITVNPYA